MTRGRQKKEEGRKGGRAAKMSLFPVTMHRAHFRTTRTGIKSWIFEGSASRGQKDVMICRAYCGAGGTVGTSGLFTPGPATSAIS
jgi:hypothetical protein